MNVKYEHFFILFVIIGFCYCVFATMSYTFDRFNMPVKCTENPIYSWNDDMWCKFPDGTSGFAKITFRNTI